MLAEADLLPAEITNDLPVERVSLDTVGLTEDLIVDLVLKTVYQRGPQTGYQLADFLRIPLAAFQGVLAEQRHLHILEVLGSAKSAFGEGAYIYQLTDKGGQRAQKALARNLYVGPAPVPFEEYCASVARQSVRRLRIDRAALEAGLCDLILNERLYSEVGPALNAASSIFFYGASGNGKTSIATRVNRLLGDPIFVPYAIEMEGSVMEFFDPMVHVAVESPERRYDRRWVRVERPSVIVGGELTADALDVYFNEHRKTYQPPYQMKANCGMFLIDDFGRQAMNPHQMLNRLIVPLESRIDYITLNTGTKLEVPFDQLVIFSTNLDPTQLADEAFLRRIKYKIHLEDPSLIDFREIFVRMCPQFGIEFDEDVFGYLVSTHYTQCQRPFRSVHPRDLLDQVRALCRYRGVAPVLTRETIDLVVNTYFAD